MKVIIIILSILGALKFISFIINCFIEVYYKIYRYYVPVSKEYSQLKRESGIYSHSDFYIFPTISIDFVNGFEYCIKFLNLEYYAFYQLEFENK